MSTNNRWLRRLAFVLALAPLAMAAIPGAARADDDHRGRGHGEHRDRGEHRGWDHDRGWERDRGYYAPPPPVYYAPPPVYYAPQPRPSPGISLFFPIR